MYRLGEIPISSVKRWRNREGDKLQSPASSSVDVLRVKWAFKYSTAGWIFSIPALTPSVSSAAISASRTSSTASLAAASSFPYFPPESTDASTCRNSSDVSGRLSVS